MYKDLTLRRFGRLIAVERAPVDHTRKSRSAIWVCRCDCGNTTKVSATCLLQGMTRSCGCYSREVKSARFTKHGMRNTRLYNIWINMMSRCSNPKNRHYKDYGGRGIKVCEEWRNVGNFLQWGVSNGYMDDLEIDRIDNDGNYEPDNCRFTTRHEQVRNHRRTVSLTFNGKTQCMADWAREVGLQPQTLRRRLADGWQLERALKP